MDKTIYYTYLIGWTEHNKLRRWVTRGIFKAIYRCIRGNIMGTKKEEKIQSFNEFLAEVEKKDKAKKREIRIPKLPPKITEPERVSVDET